MDIKYDTPLRRVRTLEFLLNDLLPVNVRINSKQDEIKYCELLTEWEHFVYNLRQQRKHYSEAHHENL